LCGLLLWPVLLWSNAITILSPNGGEKLRIWESLEITWTAESSVTEAVPWISVDGGDNFTRISTESIDRNNPSWGHYLWTIPDTLHDLLYDRSTLSDSCIVKVTDYNSPPQSGKWDISDAFFSVQQEVKMELPEPCLTLRTAMVIYPNPAIRNALTMVTLGSSTQAVARVMDVRGQVVTELFPMHSSPIVTNYQWRGYSSFGKPCAGGIYLIRIVTPERAYSSRLMLNP